MNRKDKLQRNVHFKPQYIPSSSLGQSSQGSPHPSPGILLQQHFALVVLNAFGTEHFPFSKLVKQKLWRVSRNGEKQALHQTFLPFFRTLFYPYYMGANASSLKQQDTTPAFHNRSDEDQDLFVHHSSSVSQKAQHYHNKNAFTPYSCSYNDTD